MSSKPVITIVGRPNVGKSTLFNRLIGRQTSIISSKPATTRDRIISETKWGDKEFILIDTGGIQDNKENELSAEVKLQSIVGIDESDAIIMVLDVKEEITALDFNVADILRKTNKPIILALNKTDNIKQNDELVDFYELGFKKQIKISAYHNIGIDDLMTEVLAEIPIEQGNESNDNHSDIKISIVGRPNVGKSHLLNALTNEERTIVSDIPGTTRDSIDSFMNYKNKQVMLIDTAGIRRKGQIKPGIEKASVIRTIKAVLRSDVSILMVDATELATNQDAHVLGYVLDHFRSLVIAINKWDLAIKNGMKKEETIDKIKTQFPFAKFAKIVFISAKEKSGLEDLLDASFIALKNWETELSPYDLKKFVREAISAYPPATTGRHALKIYGVRQTGITPPSLPFYVNNTKFIHFSYQRYLENFMRSKHDFEGTPIKMSFRGRKK